MIEDAPPSLSAQGAARGSRATFCLNPWRGCPVVDLALTGLPTRLFLGTANTGDGTSVERTGDARVATPHLATQELTTLERLKTRIPPHLNISGVEQARGRSANLPLSRTAQGGVFALRDSRYGDGRRRL